MAVVSVRSQKPRIGIQGKKDRKQLKMEVQLAGIHALGDYFVFWVLGKIDLFPPQVVAGQRMIVLTEKQLVKILR